MLATELSFSVCACVVLGEENLKIIRIYKKENRRPAKQGMPLIGRGSRYLLTQVVANKVASVCMRNRAASPVCGAEYYLGEMTIRFKVAPFINGSTREVSRFFLDNPGNICPLTLASSFIEILPLA